MDTMKQDNVIFETKPAADFSVTTGFESSAEATTKSFLTRVDRDSIVVTNQSMSDFLAKPVMVSDIAWATTDTFNTDIVTIDLEGTVFAAAIWKDKWSGHGLLRGDIKLRVMVNATPFHQGKLLVYWVPLSKYMANYSTAYIPMHATAMASKRMLPCVELNVRDSMAEITIPYIAPTSWVNTNTTLTSTKVIGWGSARIAVQSALKTGASGTANVNVTTWMSIENAEFAAPMYPQAGGGVASKRYKTRTMKSVTEAEADAKGSGAISSGLAIVSEAADALASVPMFAPIAGPASWVAGILSGAASAFGFSKPLSKEAPSIMAAQYGRYLATSDGVSTAVPLALKSDHAVTLTDGMSIRDEDEMSFAFLKRISTQTYKLTWADTDAIDTSLAVWNLTINPTATNFPVWELSTVTHTKVYTYGVAAPFAYLASKFELMRGSLCLTIKVIKTDFHTGRLSLVWTPGYTQASAISNANAAYSLREVFDISEANEICIMLPFMIESNYIRTIDSFGTFDIRVLNKLRAPETCSSSVELQFFFSGGPDFELACPSNGQGVAYTLPAFSPEMGGTDDVVASCGAGHSTGFVFNTTAAEQSTGEVFTSVKQLITRNNRWYPTTALTASSVSIWPWSVNAVQGGVAAPTSPNMGGDIFGYLAPMYLFYRGDMEITVSSDIVGAAVIGHTQSASVGSSDQTAAVVATSGTSNDNPTNVVWAQTTASNQQLATNCGFSIQAANNGVTSWRVPYYAKGKAALILPATAGNEISADPYKVNSVLALDGVSGYFTACRLYRQCADDFQFTFFLGSPPVLMSFA